MITHTRTIAWIIAKGINKINIKRWKITTLKQVGLIIADHCGLFSACSLCDFSRSGYVDGIMTDVSYCSIRAHVLNLLMCQWWLFSNLFEKVRCHLEIKSASCRFMFRKDHSTISFSISIDF